MLTAAPGFNKNLHQAFFHGIQIDLLGAGKNDAAHMRIDFLAFQYPGGNLQVFQTAVSTAADNRLINLNFTELADRFDIRRQMGKPLPGVRS